MKQADIPYNEDLRLNALYEYDILDTESERAFDDLTELASEICGTSISLISLVDPDRQWFKSKFGLDADETSREIAFCSHAILQKELFEVNNALEDERFFDNPLVTDSPNIRFYAGTPLKTPNGFNIGTLCVIDDKPKKLNSHQKKALELLGREVVTQLELRKHNQKLELSNRRKIEFLSSISHELRTPLNAIVGLSDLALKNSKDGATQDLSSFLEQIHFSGHRLLGVVNSILDLGKIEAGHMELELTLQDIESLLRSNIAMLMPKASDKMLEIKLDYAGPADESEFLIDEQKFSQILINLLSNAIKFSGQHTVINVTFKVTDDLMYLTVKDQGKGITEDDQKRLFSKYAQVGTDKSSQEGTGLGLAITKGLVDLCSGTIEITSEINVGTQVKVSLPIKEKVRKSPKKPQSKSVIATGLKVLVVEDNEVNQMVINAMLTKLGLDVTICGTAEDALQSIDKHVFDIVLMDINLPGMDGIEATRTIRQKGNLTPVVALTADVFRSNREKSLFNSFLTKPITFDTLKNELTGVLS